MLYIFRNVSIVHSVMILLKSLVKFIFHYLHFSLHVISIICYHFVIYIYLAVSGMLPYLRCFIIYIIHYALLYYRIEETGIKCIYTIYIYVVVVVYIYVVVHGIYTTYIYVALFYIHYPLYVALFYIHYPLYVALLP